MPSSSIWMVSRPSTSVTNTRAALASAYLATFVSASLTRKYAADSTLAGGRFEEIDFELDWQRCALRECLEGWREAAVSEQRRVDAACEFAEVGEGVCKLGAAWPPGAQGSAASVILA